MRWSMWVGVVLLAAGCVAPAGGGGGGEGGAGGTPPEDDGGVVDRGVDAGEDDADRTDAGECGAPRALCDGSCIDLRVDPAHCGGCGEACATGEQCRDGACTAVCAEGERLCGDVCVGIADDPLHCGGCDAACAEGEVCLDGACEAVEDCRETGCPGRSWCDDGVCRPGCADDDPCRDGETCDLDTHTCVCPGNACADGCFPLDDAAHCGPDCLACPDDENGAAACVDGACAVVCADGFRLCDGACAACPDGQTAGTLCDGGVCVRDGCPDGTHDCDGECVADDGVAHCGDRCAPCPVPEGGEAACVDGACAARCAPDALLCDGVCAPCDAQLADSACDGAVCVCVPDCGGLECGVDPVCGASCGTCEGDDGACRDGQCIDLCQRPAGGVLVVDVPTVSVTVDITLDGAPLDEANTTQAEHGRIVLKDPDTAEVVFTFDPLADDGTFLLPYTARLVRGEYDVIFERLTYLNSAEGENHWPVNDDRVLQRRLPILEDGPLTIDIRTAAPPIDISIDGELPAPDNISLQDRGRVVLVDPETGEDVFSYSGIDNDGTVNGFFAARLVVGRYLMRYERLDYVNDGESPGRWPVNDARMLGEVVIDDDMPRTLDVWTVAPPIDISIDGELPSPENISLQDRGRVVLVDPETGEDVFSYSGINDDGTVNGFFTARLVRGTYRTRYERLDYVNDGENPGRWPVNDERMLGEIELDDDRRRVIDIATVAPPIDISIDGELPSPENISLQDRGRVVLVDPETGEDVFSYSGINDDGTVNAFFTARLVAGRYLTRYERLNYVNDGENPGRWPVNDERILGDIVLDDDEQRVIDIPTVAPPIDIALDGALPNAGNISLQNRGRVVLVDPETGEDVFSYSGINDDGTVNGFFTARMVAGRYLARYERLNYVNDGENPGGWPVNDERLLDEVNLDDDAQVILDVPTAILRLDVTLDGARLDAETTNAQEHGDVVVFDRETGEQVFRFSAMNDDGGFSLPYSARVVAGRYAVHYERESYRNVNSPENNWPVNDERPLQCIAVP